MTWRLGIATGACIDRSILGILPSIHDSGARGIEVSTPPRHFDPWQADQIAALHRALEARALEAVSIHAPFGGLLDLADPNPHHRHAAVGAILTATAALKRLGGRVVVVHPSDRERDPRDVDGRLRDCADSLGLLAAQCRHEQMTLAVESPLPHLVGGHPDEFIWLLRQLDESVRVCLDTGHVWLGGHWEEFARVTAGRVAHVHAHDNLGSRDDHLPPGEGRIDWRLVRDTLAAMEFDGWVMLELRCMPGDMSSYLHHAWTSTARMLGGGPR